MLTSSDLSPMSYGVWSKTQVYSYSRAFYTYMRRYTGYGRAEGGCSEENCYAAIHAAYRYLVYIEHISPASIVLYGSSLGSAVSMELAYRLTLKARAERKLRDTQGREAGRRRKKVRDGDRDRGQAHSRNDNADNSNTDSQEDCRGTTRHTSHRHSDEDDGDVNDISDGNGHFNDDGSDASAYDTSAKGALFAGMVLMSPLLSAARTLPSLACTSNARAYSQDLFTAAVASRTRWFDKFASIDKVRVHWTLVSSV